MNPRVSAILLAAGSSSRMGGVNKMLISFGGLTPIERCVRAFSPYADEIIIAVSDTTCEAAENAARLSGVPVKIVDGGARRQDSVLCALKAANFEIAAIHDCARCLVDGKTILSAIEGAGEKGSGVAAVKLRDTVRDIGTGNTLDRESLALMQTPQCFDREKLLEAYRFADGSFTDDAGIWRAHFGEVNLTRGDMRNQKLTEAGDIPFFEALTKEERSMRTGVGEDTHRLVEGRKLVLGGVEIPYRLGLLGHSDADALVHAIIDAIMGAAALGDIGRHFPDKDPAYKDISSLILLEKTAEMLRKNGFRLVNADAVVTAQEPKLAPYIEKMREKIAGALNVGVESISVKATTPEGLGPEGSLQSITVRAVALIESV